MAKADRTDRDRDMDEMEDESTNPAEDIRGISDEEEEAFDEEDEEAEDLEDDEEEGIR
jgi:hypothetical protein